MCLCMRCKRKLSGADMRRDVRVGPHRRRRIASTVFGVVGFASFVGFGLLVGEDVGC